MPAGGLAGTERSATKDYLTCLKKTSRTRGMFRAVGHTLLFLAMFSIAGGHWAVLQTVAWTGMLLEYSRGSSLGVAIVKTFSGEAPCKMCRAIKQGQRNETRLPAILKADKKQDGFLVTRVCDAGFPPVRCFSYPPPLDEIASMRSTAPPVPVPIAA
jgi:hypothetical protein